MIPDLHIEATESFKDEEFDPETEALEAYLQRHRVRMEEEARAIVDALQASLPGGVFDQVARFMLERKASHFVVRWEKEPEG